MQLRELIAYLEQIAPPVYQESYDNSGLIIGSPDLEITGVLICLDSIEEVVQEAKIKGCNVIIAHHPIVFGGLKKLNGKNYVERTVIAAIKSDIAIYAIHTNLDNMLHQGVNSRIAEQIGLSDTSILLPKKDLLHFKVWANSIDVQALEPQMAWPDVQVYFNQNDQNGWLEICARKDQASKVRGLLMTRFGQDIFEQDLNQPSGTTGSGMIGRLERPIPEAEFLQMLKTKMKVSMIRHTRFVGRNVQKVAICGGSGQFLLNQAIAAGADVYISADFKYHEFFDADGRILIADIGHYESEQFTISLLYELITKKFHNFAVRFTELNTNPIHYI